MINNNIIQNPYAALLPETIQIDNDIIKNSSPAGLHHLYRLGLVNGVILDTEKTPYPYRQFAKYNFDYLKDNQEDGQSIIFEDTKYYGKIKGDGKGKRILNQSAYLKIDPKKSSFGAQSTGDCVSWAIRDAIDQLRCNRILAGMWEAYIERQATCGIYSGRGHTGQGADPVGLSRWAVQIGVLLEIVYETSKEKYDFRSYDDYVRWGMSRGRSGIPDDLLAETQKHKVGGYKVVATTDALLDLMANGMTAHCGSDLGVASFGNPISKRSGSWSHDMNVAGVDDTDWCKDKFNTRVWIWNQSWGNWNTVENIPDEWKPWGQGQFALSDKDPQWAVNDGGTVVFFDGAFFNAEPLDNKII
jgi:hypothetical protein